MSSISPTSNVIFPTSPYADQFNSPEFQQGFLKGQAEQVSFQIQQSDQAAQRSDEDFDQALELLE